jgi:serine/threonine-protein kinase
MGEVLKKFGRYFLLDHIAQGGMAEIYRARLASADGAGRLLVIKRIQAGYGGATEFLQMFKSEIKVTMGFNHPNIIQLYDFGEENGQPYIAMELVDGKNLRQFMSRFAELKQSFPVELAAYIIEQSAGGLGYAHAFKDKITGQHLNIVHRDISPQNILIAYEGTIKVIDFGIAKATTNSESTRAGVIKGKPSYLSPEQISGEPLDGRCDIFALGIVLWELLCGRKLFAGDNDLAVLKLIEACTTHVKPPSTINPKVPKELDYIVLKTLAKQREKRYQTAEELQRALHKFLYAFMPDFNPQDLSYYAKDLFKDEIVEDRKRIQKLNDKVEQLLVATDIPDIKTDDATVPLKREDTTTIVEAKGGPKPMETREFDRPDFKVGKVDLDTAPASAKQTASRPRPGSGTAGTQAGATRTQGSSSTGKVAAPQQRKESSSSGGGMGKPLVAMVAAVIGIVFVGPEFGIRIPVVSDMVDNMMGGNEARLILQGNQAGVKVEVNGQVVANGLPATVKNIPVGMPVHIAVTAADGRSFESDVTIKKGEKRELAVALTQRQVASTDPGQAAMPQTSAESGKKMIHLKLVVSPGGGATMTLNGKPIDPNTNTVDVPLDAPLELVADRQGFKQLKREFTIDSREWGNLQEKLMDVQLEPNRFGYLTIHTTPSADATILIDGKPWVKKTPLENEKVPVGTYSIKLANDVLGMEKSVTVKIEEGQITAREERLDIMGPK